MLISQNFLVTMSPLSSKRINVSASCQSSRVCHKKVVKIVIYKVCNQSKPSTSFAIFLVLLYLLLGAKCSHKLPTMLSLEKNYLIRIFMMSVYINE
jgi:hypothetical protein